MLAVDFSHTIPSFEYAEQAFQLRIFQLRITDVWGYQNVRAKGANKREAPRKYFFWGIKRKKYHHPPPPSPERGAIFERWATPVDTFNPKVRQICAAPFRERVLHHALMNVCHPYFEKFQNFDSYATRRNKGTYAALERAWNYQKKYRWFLKLDFRKYFDSIDQRILKNQLRLRFKDEKLLSVFDHIINSYEVAPGKGVPIGNLTSQYFANHYLAAADHHARMALKAPAYVRYMDDIAIWHQDKDTLLEIGKELQQYTSDTLILELKPFCLNSVDKGLPFLGYLVFPDTIRLAQRSRIRFTGKLRLYYKYLDSGHWTQAEFQNHVLPLVAFTLKSDSRGFRMNLLEKLDTHFVSFLN